MYIFRIVQYIIIFLLPLGLVYYVSLRFTYVYDHFDLLLFDSSHVLLYSSFLWCQGTVDAFRDFCNNCLACSTAMSSEIVSKRLLVSPISLLCDRCHAGIFFFLLDLLVFVWHTKTNVFQRPIWATNWRFQSVVVAVEQRCSAWRQTFISFHFFF